MVSFTYSYHYNTVRKQTAPDGANTLPNTMGFENMIAPRLFGLLVVIVRLTVGNLSLIANNESLVLTAPQNLTSLTNRPNESSPALNINHRCDTIYGIYPDIGDCQDALAAMSAGSEQMVFGERNTGLPSSAIALPFLIFGSMPFTLHDWFINRVLLWFALLLTISALIHLGC